jgi:hypothetical protein
MVIKASRHRQNVTCSAVRVVHLMNNPPVLHNNAAAKTNSSGGTVNEADGDP